jgi:formate dehydrogenase subunit beta
MKTFSLDVKDGLGKTLDALFGSMLERGGLDALFILKKTPGGFYVPALISNPEKVENVNPFAGVMTINAGTLVSNITRLTPAPGKIGVVIRPCEYRALVELVKLKQVATDNLIIMVTDCNGTFPMVDYQSLAGNKTPEQELELLGQEDRLRIACRTCEYCTGDSPEIDIRIHSIGTDISKCIHFSAASDRGAELLQKSGGKESGLPGDFTDKIKAFVEKRKKSSKEILSADRAKFSGIGAIEKTLETCIACHNCMDACPICYCKECFFESPTFEYEAEKYLRWSERKGSIRLPVGTALFHIGRLNHMAVSCVGCGMCEQACPAKIPLLALFKSVGEDLQKVFEYLPGKSVNDPLPLIVYREEELEPQ